MKSNSTPNDDAWWSSIQELWKSQDETILEQSQTDSYDKVRSIITAHEKRCRSRIQKMWASGIAACILIALGISIMRMSTIPPTDLQQSSQPAIAQTQDVEPAAEASTHANEENATKQPVKQTTAEKSTPSPTASVPARPQPATIAYNPTQVVCNNSCDSAAVINQIRSFLTDTEA